MAKTYLTPETRATLKSQQRTKAARTASAAAIGSQQSTAWEKASGRGNGTALSFPSTMSTPDVGSRTMPQPATPTRHLNGGQFGSSAPFAGLHANLSQGYLSGQGNNPGESESMIGYRASLRKAMLGSAGSSQHSLGAALNASPSMYRNEPMAGPSAVSPAKKSAAAKFLGGNRMFGRRRGLRASPHAGKNAANLKAVTGAKG